ncbi:response regulator [Paenibacillus aurantiacus]|uniref:Response regulator n=1 Tax=Paenibacillus aurantiacus TaxID=1936118 RepID=A0ABV5KTZ0_9BACL
MLNLMIVDDEELIREDIKSKVFRIAHPAIGHIEMAASAIEAKQFMRKQKPDVVISDIRMPEMDGLTLIRECAQTDPEMRFIVLSGYDDYSYVREAFKHGIVDYLLKPVRLSDLEMQLNKAIQLCTPLNLQETRLSSPGQSEIILKPTRQEQDYSTKSMINIVKQYIESRPYGEVTLAEVSSLVSMNYSYFSTWFKDETGQTFSTYIMTLRMEKAIKLLNNPTLRINEIASQVGYDNIYHFSRAFKNYSGKSPTEYRKIPGNE